MGTRHQSITEEQHTKNKAGHEKRKRKRAGARAAERTQVKRGENGKPRHESENKILEWRPCELL